MRGNSAGSLEEARKLVVLELARSESKCEGSRLREN